MGLTTQFLARSDLHQSPMYAKVMEDLGWITVGQAGSHIFLKKLGPFTLGKMQRPEKIDLSYVNSIRRQHHSLTLYLEPKTNEGDQKLGISSEPFAHSATSIIDISQSVATLLASFNQTTRRHIVAGLKNENIKITSIPLAKLTEHEHVVFAQLHAEWDDLRRGTSHPQSYLESVMKHFAGYGHLHLAYQDNLPCALLLTLYHDDVATYYTAFANESGYTSGTPTLLTWTALLTAKKAGCDLFDFGGIYDERYPKLYKNWQGFTRFKTGFRPTTVLYPPSYLKLFW